MKGRLLVGAGIALATAIGAAPAFAQRTTCPIGHYYSGINENFPPIADLRTHGLPQLTGGYAPRCLVAETVAINIQAGYAQAGYHVYFPRHFRVGGASWSAAFRCRYLTRKGYEQDTYKEARCFEAEHPERRVTMNLVGGGERHKAPEP